MCEIEGKHCDATFNFQFQSGSDITDAERNINKIISYAGFSETSASTDLQSDGTYLTTATGKCGRFITEDGEKIGFCACEKLAAINMLPPGSHPLCLDKQDRLSKGEPNQPQGLPPIDTSEQAADPNLFRDFIDRSPHLFDQ